MAIDSFTPVNKDEKEYTRVSVVVGAEELSKSIGKAGFIDKGES